MGKTHPTGGILLSIRIVSVPLASLCRVNSLLRPLANGFAWRVQPAFQDCAQLQLKSSGGAASLPKLVSELAKIEGIHFDIEDFSPELGGERFLYQPGLGIRRIELDQLGEPVISGAVLQHLLIVYPDSIRQLKLEVLKCLGEPWQTTLEQLDTWEVSPTLIPAIVNRGQRKRLAN